MATNYPGSLDTSTQQPSPSASTEMDDSGFEHDAVHTNHSGAIIALETKVGTGDSNAVANSVLAGTGSGTSGWSTAPSLAGLTVDTDTLYVDATNDRVGIGTTTPAAELDVSAASSPDIRLTSEKDGSWTDGESMGSLSFYSSDTSGGGADVRGRVATVAGDQYGYVSELALSVGGDSGLFEAVRIDHDGKVGIGTTSPAATLDVAGDTTSTGHFTAQSGGADGGIVLGQTYATDYVGLRTAGMGEASANEYVIMSNGTTTFISGGTGGDVYIRAGANSSSCQIVLDSDQDDIDMTGDVAITGTLTTTGAITGSGVITANEFRASDIGPASDPAFTFDGDGDTGMYSDGSNSISFSTAGTQRLDIDGGGIKGKVSFSGPSGSAGTPGFNFDGDTDTGMYRVTTNQVGFATSGTLRGRFWSSGLLMGNASTGNAQIGTGTGSASAPTYHFYGDTDTGMYRYTTNQIALVAGGVDSLIGAAGTINTAGLATTTTSGFRYVMRNSTYGTLYHYTSSADLKENITNVTASDAAAWIDALQPVTFNERWLQDGTESDEDRAFREADIQVGFIADDVLANSTSAKFAQVEDVDGTLKGVGWKWECVIAAAVAEIKSLRARVADLEAA